jgi:hypothetical protein
LLGEILARVAGYQPNRLPAHSTGEEESWAKLDTEKGWINHAGSFRSIDPGYVVMSFLPDGRRLDSLRDKGTDKPKIVAVGCSFTQGYGVLDSETYPHLVNSALSGAEVLNYGTGGYGTYQSLMRIRSYFPSQRSSPTPLIIYGLIGAHATRNVAGADWILGLPTHDGGHIVPPHARIVAGEMIERPGYHIDRWLLEERSAFATMFHRVTITLTYTVSDKEKSEVLHRLVELMNDTVRRNGSSLLVVGLDDVPNGFAEWAADHRIDYNDCVDLGFAKGDPALHIGGVGHPSALLHRRWARCVLTALVSRGFAPADAKISRADAVN